MSTSKMETKCGKAAKSFALPDTTNRIHRSNEYFGSWLLLVFHRHLG